MKYTEEQLKEYLIYLIYNTEIEKDKFDAIKNEIESMTKRMLIFYINSILSQDGKQLDLNLI